MIATQWSSEKADQGSLFFIGSAYNAAAYLKSPSRQGLFSSWHSEKVCLRVLSITGICFADSGLQKAVADWAHVAQFLFVARAKSPGEFIVAKESLLNELLGPVVESMGYTFWGLEYLSQGKQTVLRVFIDHENGITVDDCAAVSRQISSVMDVEDPISQVYNLEVSSPGMDRPVFTLEQYQSLAGNIIDVRLRMAFDGRRKFKGQLIGVEQEDIVLRVDDNEYLLPIELIEKANVVPQFKD